MAPDSALASSQGSTPEAVGASGRSGWARVTDEPLLAVLAAAVVGLLLWSLTSLDARISENGDRITRLEEKLDDRFVAFEEKLDDRFVAFVERVDARFAAVDERFDEMDAEIDEISENMAAVLAILRAGDNAGATGADGSQKVVAAASESDRPN